MDYTKVTHQQYTHTLLRTDLGFYPIDIINIVASYVEIKIYKTENQRISVSEFNTPLSIPIHREQIQPTNTVVDIFDVYWYIQDDKLYSYKVGSPQAMLVLKLHLPPCISKHYLVLHQQTSLFHRKPTFIYFIDGSVYSIYGSSIKCIPSYGPLSKCRSVCDEHNIYNIGESNMVVYFHLKILCIPFNMKEIIVQQHIDSRKNHLLLTWNLKHHRSTIWLLKWRNNVQCIRNIARPIFTYTDDNITDFISVKVNHIRIYTLGMSTFDIIYV